MRKAKPSTLVATVLLLSSCAQRPVTHEVTPAVAMKKETTPWGARVPSSDEEEVVEKGVGDHPWTTWSQKGTVGGLTVLRHIRENLLKNNLHDPHIDYSGYEDIDCSKQNTNFRSANGTCNDLEKPHAGAAGVAFGRNVPPEFIDLKAEEKIMTPHPALVSKVFFTRNEFKPVPFLNMLAASWIQFMNHDWLTHGKNMESNPRRVQRSDGTPEWVERTQENPVNSNIFKKEFGKVTANDVTHWWDGSQIYGSSWDQQKELRSFKNGRMTTVKVNGRELLPKNNMLDIRMNKQNHGLEVTGFRDNMWVGLSMLHHLFVLEHNAIADMLYKKHARFDEESGKYIWDESGLIAKVRNSLSKHKKGLKFFTEEELDEHIFQTARLINSAIMAKIHTVEWTPAILPNKVLKKAMFTNWYGLANPQTWSKLLKKIPALNKTDWFSGMKSGYLIGGIVGNETNNYGVPFSITEEFTSVYRLHSLLPEEINLRRYEDRDRVVAVPFDATRNEKSYEYFANYDLKDLFYSFGVQKPGQLVLNNFPKFMQELNIPGHGKMDLAMVDIIRDRERGVPRYNQFRRAISLKPITKYEDFFMNGVAKTPEQKKVVENFRKVYGVDSNGNDNVEMIDLLVGTSAEEIRPENFGFGETMFQIFIVMASRRLMADRFFTSDYKVKNYTKAGMNWIDDEGFMHKVIGRHMPELIPHMKGLETAFSPWKN